MLKWGLVRWSKGSGFILPSGASLSVPTVMKFPDFTKPRIVASLVAGATYSQSGTTVTVTATGNGLQTARNGSQIFWPGSAAIPAGWYDDFQSVSADVFTFTNPIAQNVAAGSPLTGTLPYTALTTFCSAVIPGGEVGPTGDIAIVFTQSGDTAAGAKNVRSLLGGSWMGLSAVTTAPFARRRLVIAAVGSSLQVGQNAVEGSAGGQQYSASNDMTKDVTLALAGSVTNAGQWVGIDSVSLVLTK